MTDDARAACRAALLKACRATDVIIGADREGIPIESVCVDVDDAASLMARFGQECFDRGAHVERYIGRPTTGNRNAEIRAALAAAQEER